MNSVRRALYDIKCFHVYYYPEFFFFLPFCFLSVKHAVKFPAPRITYSRRFASLPGPHTIGFRVRGAARGESPFSVCRQRFLGHAVNTAAVRERVRPRRYRVHIQGGTFITDGFHSGDYGRNSPGGGIILSKYRTINNKCTLNVRENTEPT